ncbi:DUF6461 domain-containing protein [Streptomyces sp. ALB3]|uniref:DUF6461 domain-containing protein n=1 Tax=Streptomyces sp. ALB3 TaxID=3374278 RepID=UPI0037D9F104
MANPSQTQRAMTEGAREQLTRGFARHLTPVAERITGVRLTPALFASAEYTCARVPDPFG